MKAIRIIAAAAFLCSCISCMDSKKGKDREIHNLYLYTKN